MFLFLSGFVCPHNILHAATVLSMPFYVEHPVEHLVEQLKNRVSNVAVALFGVAVLASFIDIYFVRMVLSEFRLPSTVSVSFTSLLGCAVVPLLGYIGATREKRGWVCCFAWCNCCKCCGSIILLVVCMGLLVVTSFVTDSLTNLDVSLQRCDAFTFCPLTAGQPQNEYGLVNDAKSTDCLARSVWTETYHPIFPDFGSPLSQDCPTFLFLNCSFHILGPQPDGMEAINVELDAFQQVREARHRPLPHQPGDGYPLLNNCRVKGDLMESFHRAATQLPDVMDRLSFPLWVLTFLDATRVILSCLGIMWGCQLHSVLKKQHADAQQLAKPLL